MSVFISFRFIVLTYCCVLYG